MTIANLIQIPLKQSIPTLLKESWRQNKPLTLVGLSFVNYKIRDEG